MHTQFGYIDASGEACHTSMGAMAPLMSHTLFVNPGASYELEILRFKCPNNIEAWTDASATTLYVNTHYANAHAMNL